MAKITVIEDDMDLCDTLKDALEIAGHKVEAYYSGTEAIDAFVRRRVVPDVVVLDMQLPGTSGMVVLGLIRRMPRMTKTRIIISSGHADAGQWAVKQWGADLFLQKPLSLDVLKKVINEFTRESGGSTTDVSLPATQPPLTNSTHAADVP